MYCKLDIFKSMWEATYEIWLVKVGHLLGYPVENSLSHAHVGFERHLLSTNSSSVRYPLKKVQKVKMKTIQIQKLSPLTVEAPLLWTGTQFDRKHFKTVILVLSEVIERPIFLKILQRGFVGFVVTWRWRRVLWGGGRSGHGRPLLQQLQKPTIASRVAIRRQKLLFLPAIVNLSASKWILYWMS